MPSAALAGPPFLTDDPEPTEVGHWEIYAPLFEAEGTGSDYYGAVGAEINYGPADGVQFTVGLPFAYAHGAGRTSWGAGDLEASVKYRFYRNEANAVQIAVFPGITLPTGSNGMSARHVTALLPIWLQKDVGRWSLFGGGGYAINPGAANKNFWTGGAAIVRQFNDRLTLGIEADVQGPDEVGGAATTSLGIGAIYDLPGPLRLLASGGPSFHADGRSGFHAFLAVGIDY
jgi:hypothetical protein